MFFHVTQPHVAGSDLNILSQLAREHDSIVDVDVGDDDGQQTVPLKMEPTVSLGRGALSMPRLRVCPG